MSVLSLPPDFVERIPRVYGDRGRAWLEALPQRVAQCRAQWRLTHIEPCPGISLNYLEFARRGDDAVALKLGVHADEFAYELEALRLYGGRGAVDCLAVDVEHSAALLERLAPGTPLAEWGDNVSQTRAFVSVLESLETRAEDDHGFPTYRDWIGRAFRKMRDGLDPTEQMPRTYLSTVERIVDDLTRDPVLLHGDLHHGNILRHGAGWVAIDPTGVVGDPRLDIGRFVRNQLPEDDRLALERVDERLDVLSAALDEPRRDLAAVSFVDVILSQAWSFGDEGGPTDSELERTLLLAGHLQLAMH